jgi:hypothetical protein
MAKKYFDMLFYCVSRTENSSLSFMVSFLKSEFGVKITKQSLDERFGESCVSYSKLSDWKDGTIPEPGK